MEDNIFLQHALKQSFNNPIINAVSGLSMDNNLQHSTGYLFKDIKHPNLTAFLLPYEQIKKISHFVESDIRHSINIHEICAQYRHDINENIVIPENYPEVEEIHRKFEMLTVNRQNAQKKRLSATIIPADFMTEMQNIRPQYHMIMQNVEHILQNNPLAFDATLMNEFALNYKQVMQYFRPIRPSFWLNKKRFIYYINEAAQILKSSYPLPIDFYETHTFVGDTGGFGSIAAKICRDKLQFLITILQKLSHEKQWLNLAQFLLADESKYTEELKLYKQQQNIKDIVKITALRKNAQKFFENYAFLVYLNGVRFAFENKYIGEYSATLHPPLPTVSPKDEIIKIHQIIADSRKIVSNGKISQIYIQALKKYKNSQEIIQALLLKDII